VVLASAVAVLHGAVVLVMLTGALLALRWPRLVLLHVPVALAVLAVNLAGAPCPLTTLELALRERAGAAPYDGGFLGHFLFGPLGLDVGDPAVQAGTYAVAFASTRSLRAAGRPRPPAGSAEQARDRPRGDRRQHQATGHEPGPPRPHPGHAHADRHRDGQPERGDRRPQQPAAGVGRVRAVVPGSR
jgi:hypothetical protein